MADKLTQVQIPNTGAEPFLNIQIREKRPVLGMTLMKITGAYSLDALCKLSKKNPDKKIFSELYDLQKQVYSCKNVTEFLSRFHSRNGELRDNAELKAELKRIRGTFDKEFSDNIIHIHSKPLGKGQFTLFGFVYDNVFEILLLDPEHEIAG